MPHRPLNSPSSATSAPTPPRVGTRFRCVCIGSVMALMLLTGIFTTDIKGDKRTVKYSFPTAITGVEMGREALLGYIKNEDLRSRDVVDYLFGNLPLHEMANVLRTRLGDDELRALDVEFDEVKLFNLVRGSTSDASLAEALDDQGISDRSLQNRLADVFDEYYPSETAAYWVEHGYNERYMLVRLKRKYDADIRFENIDRHRRHDMDSPTSIWSDRVRDLKLVDQLTFYLGMEGRPKESEIKKILNFEEEDLVLTPELMRVVSFGDPQLIAVALLKAGIEPRVFSDAFDDILQAHESDSTATAIAGQMIDRLEAREDAESDWLMTRGDQVTSIYRGTLKGTIAFPVLGDLEGDKDGSKHADYGITTSLMGYFSATEDTLLVLYKNNSVRALISGVRYEGLLKRDAGTLDLVAVYGGKDWRFTAIKQHGKGLLLELSIVDAQPDSARRLFRRVRSY